MIDIKLLMVNIKKMPNTERNNRGQFKKNNTFNKKKLEKPEADAETNYKLLLGRGYFVFSASLEGDIVIYLNNF